MGEFGDKFRKAREKKELSLDDVSNVTKISARMLRAIEEEHFDDLPGGVFNKGFIRAYAKHLGLDAEEAVSDYLESLRQAQVDAHEVWDPQPPKPVRPAGNGDKARSTEAKRAAPKSQPAKPPAPVEVEELPELQLPRIEDVRPNRKELFKRAPTAVPLRIVAAAALVLALGLFLWVRHSKKPQPAITAKANPVQTPSVQAELALPSSSAPAPQSVVSNPQPVSHPAPPPEAAKSSPPAPAPVAAPGKSADSGDVAVKNFTKPRSNPAEKAAPALSLVIRATENTWISAFADGQLVTQETLIAPANTSIRASRQITVRVGNAAGVSFIFNGKEITAQGAEAEVQNVTFDSSGMHVSPSTPASTPIP